MPSNTLAVVPLDHGDTAVIDAVYDAHVAAIAHDVPDYPRTSRLGFDAGLRVPWPGEEKLHHVALGADGELVGHLKIELATLDNLETAFVEICVPPAQRRRGVGRVLFERARSLAREHGRTRIMGMTCEALPDGEPREPAGTEFARSMGLTIGLTEVRRRLDLRTTDWTGLDDMLAAARRKAAGYRVVSWGNVVPDEYVEGVALLDSDFLNQAPMGELALEAEKFDVGRVRAVEEARQHYGRRICATAAVHEESGQVVALSDLARQDDQPEYAGQGITLVNPGHRGHRLGLLTKIENLRRAVDRFPEMRYIDTWNAAVNAHMIAINEQMGFRAVDQWHDWQGTA